jgi:hypothetical protein
MEDPQLNEHLVGLAPFVGRTWRGEFADSTPDKPMVDVTRWERALNGNGVRILHSVNDGQYGGETVIVWDSSEASLVYFYFTTSGFYTRGKMTVTNGHYVSHETVTGDSSGITEVKSTAHIAPDGSQRVLSQYFKNGAWVEGHEVTYRVDDQAEVVFR